MIKAVIIWILLNIGIKILLIKNWNVGAITNKLNEIEITETKYYIVIRISAPLIKTLKAKFAYIHNNFPGYLQISKTNLAIFLQMIEIQLNN